MFLNKDKIWKKAINNILVKKNIRTEKSRRGERPFATMLCYVVFFVTAIAFEIILKY
jgi:hypothetical protein